VSPPAAQTCHATFYLQLFSPAGWLNTRQAEAEPNKAAHTQSLPLTSKLKQPPQLSAAPGQDHLEKEGMLLDAWRVEGVVDGADRHDQHIIWQLETVLLQCMWQHPI